MTIPDGLQELLLAPIHIAFQASKWAGTITGSLVTLLIASPGILADLGLKSLDLPRGKVKKLRTVSLFDKHFDTPKFPLYIGGFLSRYPLGKLGQAAALITDLAVTIPLFLAFTTVGYALQLSAVASFLALSIAVIVLDIAIALVRSFIVGPQKAQGESDVCNFLYQRMASANASNTQQKTPTAETNTTTLETKIAALETRTVAAELEAKRAADAAEKMAADVALIKTELMAQKAPTKTTRRFSFLGKSSSPSTPPLPNTPTTVFSRP